MLKIDIEKIKDGIIEPLKCEYKESTLSTNEDLKVLLKKDSNKDYLLVASEQSGGRGRIGHSFSSPKGGIYLSLSIRVDKLNQDEVSLLTPIAGYAVAKAIEEVLNKDVSLKWINDVLFNGKKICGILAEAIIDGGITNVIIGIGIDYAIDVNALDEELRSIVGTIYDCGKEEDKANELIIAIVNNVFECVNNLPKRDFLDDYRAKCITIGSDISYVKNNVKKCAKAVGVNEKGELVIEGDAGRDTLNAGEVSLVRNANINI